MYIYLCRVETPKLYKVKLIINQVIKVYTIVTFINGIDVLNNLNLPLLNRNLKKNKKQKEIFN